MTTIFSVLTMVWQFFTQVECPFLGITFAELFLGVAVINFSIRILKPILGVGASANRDIGIMSRSVSRQSHNKE